jgi:hypothetical protein
VALGTTAATDGCLSPVFLLSCRNNTVSAAEAEGETGLIRAVGPQG